MTRELDIGSALDRAVTAMRRPEPTRSVAAAALKAAGFADLYEALDGLLRAVDGIDYAYQTCASLRGMDRARAALSRARGEQP